MSAVRACVSKCLPPLAVATQSIPPAKVIMYIPHMTEYMCAYADLEGGYRFYAWDRKYHKTLGDAMKDYHNRAETDYMGR